MNKIEIFIIMGISIIVITKNNNKTNSFIYSSKLLDTELAWWQHHNVIAGNEARFLKNEVNKIILNNCDQYIVH